ncbi:MAG: AAA family ATPase [Burkholderiales bacterium RIFCSPLOWO2_02_FULL_57_36]|nr:MAG: AAA family ATPase [Burkholderiales bacterium RIFCSPLOWO2_02_FULL_57_36]
MPDGAVTNDLTANARSLEREVAWFGEVLSTRFNAYFAQGGAQQDIRSHAPPDLNGDPSVFARTVQECGMGFDERIVLILTLIPHIRPQALDLFFTSNKNIERGFTEFGGWKGKSHGGMLPTCETAAFVIAGDDLNRRFEVARLFEPGHFFARRGIIRVETQTGGEPFFGSALIMETDYLNRFTTGQHHKPDYGAGFPAKLITTPLAWSDLVVTPEVMDEIENVKAWLKQGQELMRHWGLDKAVKPGFRTLFYGPPGTGKTLTATLLGKAAEVDVYRIDLSMVVSKYIGETEKNLANVFDQAQNKNWILFFDEADALFGKRTEGSTSNDRHANQEISYLLQRVEDFPGVVILATNLKTNIDEAFARRFQTSIYFPIPDALQRRRLWQHLFPDQSRLDASVDLDELAENHVLSGGALANVARYAAIRASRMQREKIAADDLLRAIKKEFLKEGRTL